MRASLGSGPGFLLLLVLAACRGEGSRGTKASASASARPAASVPRGPAPAPVAKEEAPLCRVIALRPSAEAKADAGSGENAPAMGTAFQGHDWLDLAGKTEVVLRHSATTRELALRGPGRFLPCFLGTETVLVARGGVKTTAGAGARAGAEVILATPFGTLHFADAALELRVGERDVEMSVRTGTAAWVPAVPPAADAGAPAAVLGPKGVKKLAGKVDAAGLVSRCGEASSPLGGAPPRASAGARSELGEWSVAQLRARQTARFTCAAARAAVGTKDGAERTLLWAELSKLDRVWRPTR